VRASGVRRRRGAGRISAERHGAGDGGQETGDAVASGQQASKHTCTCRAAGRMWRMEQTWRSGCGMWHVRHVAWA
jgi:hypothetical protein